MARDGIILNQSEIALTVTDVEDYGSVMRYLHEDKQGEFMALTGIRPARDTYRR